MKKYGEGRGGECRKGRLGSDLWRVGLMWGQCDEGVRLCVCGGGVGGIRRCIAG